MRYLLLIWENEALTAAQSESEQAAVFAETREQLGGYYLIECETLEDACRYDAQIPGARQGAIEVRPIMELGG